MTKFFNVHFSHFHNGDLAGYLTVREVSENAFA